MSESWCACLRPSLVGGHERGGVRVLEGVCDLADGRVEAEAAGRRTALILLVVVGEAVGGRGCRCGGGRGGGGYCGGVPAMDESLTQPLSQQNARWMTRSVPNFQCNVPLVAGAAVVADGHHLCCSWDLNLDMSAVDPLVRVEDKRWGEVDGLSSEVVRLL